MTERPRTILVVDDVPENVRLLAAVLAPRGYEAVTPSQGMRLLRLKTQRPSRSFQFRLELTRFRLRK